MRQSWLCDLGTMPYAEAFDLQKSIHALQVEGRLADGLLLVEHPPVITTGRLSNATHLFTSRERLSALGIEVAETDRGGQMTYHGPGQIVAYPLVNVTATGLSLHAFVRALEQAVIDTLAEFGITAGRVPEHTGVWVGDEKICAIGLRIRRWWSLHGLALNIHPNLDHFGLFIPCGIADRGVTSLSRLLDRPVEVDEVKPILSRHLGRLLQCEWAERIEVGTLRRRIGIHSPIAASQEPPAQQESDLCLPVRDPERSLKGGSLEFTLPLPALGCGIESPATAVLVAALGVAEALEPFSPVKPMVRWPGDIIVQGRTVGTVTVVSTDPTDSLLPSPASLALAVSIRISQTEDSNLEQESAGPTDPSAETTSLALERFRATGNESLAPMHSPDHRRLRERERKRGGAASKSKTGESPAAPPASLADGDSRKPSLPPFPAPGIRSLQPLDPSQIQAAVVDSVGRRLGQSWDQVRAPLVVRCSTLGRGVEINRDDQDPLVGLAVGLGPDGALEVQITSDRLERCRSGRLRELPHV